MLFNIVSWVGTNLLLSALIIFAMCQYFLVHEEYSFFFMPIKRIMASGQKNVLSNTISEYKIYNCICISK